MVDESSGLIQVIVGCYHTIVTCCSSKRLEVFGMMPEMKKTFTYSRYSSSHHEKEGIPLEIARSLDAILVLGGGVPSSIASPPEYVKCRCEAAAKIALSVMDSTKNHEGNTNSMPAILCLSAGTAHLPQLLSKDGLPIWESTASAAYILDTFHSVPPSNVFAETTSYDTISNAFFARTSFTDVVGWKRLLIVTNEFHMDRTREIFQWIFGTENAMAANSCNQYELYFLSCSNDGLSDEAINARKEHEARGAKNVRDNLSKRFVTLQDVWKFLTTEHDFYSAAKLAQKGREGAIAQTSENNAALKDSYGAKSSAKSVTTEMS